MSLRRSSSLLVPAAAAATMFCTAATSFAEPAVRVAPSARTLFTWNGTVDREVLLVIRGRNVETRASGLDASFPARVDQRDELPREAGDLQVHLANGRGEVEVVQQPTPRNDFTAIVRVMDQRAGADRYQLVASWNPILVIDPRGRGDEDRNPGRGHAYGRGNGRGNDRDDDRYDDRSDGRYDDRYDGRYDGRNRDAGRLSWRGDVDDVAEIRLQGRRVEFRSRSGQLLRDVRYDVRGAGLPMHPVSLELNVDRGRGIVEVVQQPSRSNGYSAIIRVIDRRAGYGTYDFDLRWY